MMIFLINFGITNIVFEELQIVYLIIWVIYLDMMIFLNIFHIFNVIFYEVMNISDN